MPEFGKLRKEASVREKKVQRVAPMSAQVEAAESQLSCINSQGTYYVPGTVQSSQAPSQSIVATGLLKKKPAPLTDEETEARER